MTRVDFYVLPGSDPQARELFACRLAEKAYNLGHRVYIHVDGQPQAAALDRLLWTFKQHSFVPHAVDGSSPDPQAQVLIGFQEALSDPDQHREVLINLAPQVPLFFSGFDRVAEIIDQNPAEKNAGRERYRFYRDRGYSLESHNIG